VASTPLAPDGVRADVFADGETSKAAVDLRFTALPTRASPRRRSTDSDDSVVWLKGSAGIYHQPPRFVLPLPGLDMMPLRFGLLLVFFLLGFFNYMDPTIFDLGQRSIDRHRRQ
jgi:hypothetical protein